MTHQELGSFANGSFRTSTKIPGIMDWGRTTGSRGRQLYEFLSDNTEEIGRIRYSVVLCHDICLDSWMDSGRVVRDGKITLAGSPNN